MSETWRGKISKLVWAAKNSRTIYNRLNDIYYGQGEYVRGPLNYNADGLSSIHNCDFINEKLFSESYKLGEATGSWGGASIRWRAYIACWVANKVKSLDGDFVECGVNKGGLSRTVIHFTEFNNLNKTFYLLDTYSGLSEKYISDEEKKTGRKAGGYEECYEAVKATFNDFNVEIIKGTVPDTLHKVKSKTVCYLSIDMNCVEPEIAAANYFWDKMVSGGILLLDDYGWPGHEEQKKGFDDFALQKGVMILFLPTGQGLIFKP